MSEPLYSKPLRALDHRLLWWLLQHQTYVEGKPTGIVKSGWRAQAREELKTYRMKIYEAEKRLRAAGVILSEKHQRNLRINGDAFK